MMTMIVQEVLQRNQEKVLVQQVSRVHQAVNQMAVKTKKNNFQADQQLAGSLTITYYTDPLCCWSWGFEPQWRRLLFEYQGSINHRYCMGGLLPGWKNYHDPINNVSRPIQMG